MGKGDGGYVTYINRPETLDNYPYNLWKFNSYSYGGISIMSELRTNRIVQEMDL